tara:strand:+ start:309 stop:920 length:612 start_codon:yes stop_codon:yes gene_type:complete
MGRRIVTIGVMLFCLLGGTAKAELDNYLNQIDWQSLEQWTYSYDYEMYEDSPMVEWLQYWLNIEPKDGIYGPQTNREHRQKAMELNITVRIHDYVVPYQNFGAAVEQWRNEVVGAIARYGGPATDVNKFLRVMRCESGGDPEAYNAGSGASGLMQHLSNYFPWRAKMAGYEGASPFDPIANINTSAWLLYEHTAGGWQHWVCQ